MRVIIASVCFLLAQHVFGQGTRDFQDDLDTIQAAFTNTNTRPYVLANSTERVGFWGEWDNGRLLTQVDDKILEGRYRFNPNPRGKHDFYFIKDHKRLQVLPVGPRGRRSTAKTLSETLFQDGKLHMRFNEASVAIFRRVPKGWFDVETFTLGPVSPDASYLNAVDYEFILRQNTLLDLSLMQEKYISGIERLSGDDIPSTVSGRCFSVSFSMPGASVLSSLGVGANDFSGFEVSEVFRTDLYRDASASVKVCVTSEDEPEPLVLFTETIRSGEDVATRLAGRDITMRFLLEKKTFFGYVDEIQFPDLKNDARKSRFLAGWVAGAALLLWVL